MLLLTSAGLLLGGEPAIAQPTKAPDATHISAVLPARTVFELAGGHEGPVIGKGDPGTEGNKYGLEGGCVLKEKGVYHLFTSELCGDPKWTKMRMAHWESTNGLKWQRVATLWESSGEYTGRDPRAALWAPMPIYNQAESRWNLFYTAYRSKPNEGDNWYANYEGRIWRAASKVSGREGLGGPYVDGEVILEPGADSGPWEGLQGADSFYPYRVGNRWYAFFGSAQTQSIQNTNYPKWAVGLASAGQLAGPWKRCNERNPVVMNRVFVENPVVTRLKDGTYAAVVDGGPQGQFGYTVSKDGVTWSEVTYIDLTKKLKPWWSTMRTPGPGCRRRRTVHRIFHRLYPKRLCQHGPS